MVADSQCKVVIDEAVLEERWQRSVVTTTPSSPHPFRVLGDLDSFLYLGRHALVQHLIESPVWLNDIHFVLERIRASENFSWEAALNAIRKAKAVTANWALLTILKSGWGTPVPNELMRELEKEVSFVRRRCLGALNPLDKLFPVGNRNLKWVIAARFLLRDNTWEAVKYAASRQRIQDFYSAGNKKSERENFSLGSLKANSGHA